jgi:hypothetical protein
VDTVKLFLAPYADARPPQGSQGKYGLAAAKGSSTRRLRRYLTKKACRSADAYRSRLSRTLS